MPELMSNHENYFLHEFLCKKELFSKFMHKEEFLDDNKWYGMTMRSTLR